MFQVILSLFLVMNALGNIPVFISILSKYTLVKQKKIIIRELLIALLILLIFNFFGDEVMELLGISTPIIGIAGGALLLIIALGMIFPKSNGHPLPSQEPFIVPLAMPILAGPGTITTVMVYTEQQQNVWLMSLAILCAWIPTTIILFSAAHIRKFLGEKGLTAMERLGGMLICLIAVKMLAYGILELFQK